MTEESYINILGKRIDYTDARVSIDALKFYEKNPRVLSKLTQADGLDIDDEDKRQELIMREMMKESSVQTLLKTIKSQGGISEPLIVQYSNSKVLEGNSRLAALKILYDRYQKEEYFDAPCKLVTLNEDQIDAFLHLQHVDGKTEWSAYAKAYSAYHRVVRDKVSIDDYVQRTSVSKKQIEKQIEVIKLMKEQGATNKTERFSYYDVVVGSTKLKQSFENNSDLKNFVLNKIKEEPLDITAQDLRDKVPLIAKKPRFLKRWIDKKIDFEEAVELSMVSEPIKYMNKAIDSLNEIKSKDMEKLDKNDKNALKQKVKYCVKEIKRIEKILERDGT